MWLRHSVSLLVAAALLSSLGCGGYQFAGESPLVLPEGHRSLAIEEIDNPTMETWLSPLLRSSIRDELTRRGGVDWTDRSGADARLTVRVLRYTVGAQIKNDQDETLKKVVEVRIEAFLTRSSDETRIWESGPIIAHETFLSDNELSDSRTRAVQLAVRELADRLGHAF